MLQSMTHGSERSSWTNAQLSNKRANTWYRHGHAALWAGCDALDRKPSSSPGNPQ